MSAAVTPAAAWVQRPIEILGVKLICDIDAARVVYSGGKVVAAYDQSKRGNHFVQNTVSLQPAHISYTTEAAYPSLVKSAIRCGPNKYLENTALVGLASGDRPYIYCVFRNNLGTGGAFAAWGICGMTASSPAGDVTNDFAFELRTTPSTGIDTKDGSSRAIGYSLGNSVYYSAMMMLTAKYEAATFQSEFDCYDYWGPRKTGSVASPGGLQYTPVHFMLGRSFVYSGGCDIHRLIIANPAPSAGEHTAMRTYLQNEYRCLST